jgi:glycosyltransferase involved in cell wall biosynthesis
VVVIVNDGSRFSRNQRREIEALLSPLPAVILKNTHVPGAAGAWNLGLAYLHGCHNGFVALLDDDDEWDAGHLEINRAAALRSGADVVVSGLRRTVDGSEVPRPLVERLDARDFLVGNPGWQGSNTFVSMRRLAHVRGFRNGLASLNDRDLAVRVLRSPGVRTACTGEWTSTWHVSSSRTTLSTARSVAKISGLRWFWRIYGPEMSPDEASAFFQRADRCFGVLADEILHPGGDVPPHRNFHGDLHL